MNNPVIHIHSFDETQPGITIAHITAPVQLQVFKNLTTLPHRHDFYGCFLVENGALDLRIDFEPLTMTAGMLVISYPGQVHEFPDSLSDGFQGWLLAIRTALVQQEARMIIEDSLAKIALLTLDLPKQQWFKTMFELIRQTGGDPQTRDSDAQVIRSLIQAFMIRAAALLQASENKNTHEHTSRSVALTKAFKVLVKEHVQNHKKPADYATLLNITVSYLNDTVKSMTGFPTTYFIQQEMLIEAQRLLVYSEKSVQEIAYQLGYDDYKYFIRLFGKLTGLSPSKFRSHHKTNLAL